MYKSFFFIPGNNVKFINNVHTINSDYFIFDMEDSVKEDERDLCLKNLSMIENKNHFFVRFSFFTTSNHNLNTLDFEALLNLGFTRFLIPKFSNYNQIIEIENYLKNSRFLKGNIEFIPIVEHPGGLLCLNRLLQEKLLNVFAIGFGSHDYCNFMGMKHTLENLYYARQVVLNTTKAYNIDAIDIVSLNLEDDENFIKECLNGFNMGYSGKFLIHPKQLELLKHIQFYSDDEIAEAEKVYEKILEIENQNTSIVKIDGKIYERPHINRIRSIIKWRNRHGN